MVTRVLMPKGSDTMTEGKVLKWVKSEGDSVATGDAVFGSVNQRESQRGTLGEYLRCGEDEFFVRKPDGLAFERAACLPLSGIIAYRIDALLFCHPLSIKVFIERSGKGVAKARQVASAIPLRNVVGKT